MLLKSYEALGLLSPAVVPVPFRRGDPGLHGELRQGVKLLSPDFEVPDHFEVGEQATVHHTIHVAQT